MRAGASGTIAATALLMASAGPVVAQDGMPSFSSDAELWAFLDTEPPPVEAPPPPPPPPPPPIYHARPAPLPAAGQLPRPAGPILHDPPLLDSPADVVDVPGVDEGDVVQAVGDHLVILRRGRLFSVATAGEDLRVVDVADAFAPGALALRDWSEQMFATGDIVTVVAFSAARDGREISRFRVASDGALSWIDTHQLLEGGGYGRPAARVVDGRLILVADTGRAVVRRWSPETGRWVEVRTIAHDETYVPAPLKRAGAGGDLGDVTVTRCDLTAAGMACDAVRTLAPVGGIEFHIARDAAWVWTGRSGGGWPGEPAWLYRIPHDGGRPSAIEVAGDPVGPRGFGLDPGGRRMTVLVKQRRAGETDFDLGLPTLVRIDVDSLGDGSRAAPRSAYLTLPGATDTRVHNYAVAGGGALYAHRNLNAFNQTDQLVAVAAQGRRPEVLEETRDFYRLTPAGNDVLAVGAGAGLALNVVDLDAPGGPVLGPTWSLTGTASHESRDYPFRHARDASAPDGERGLLAVPVGASMTPLDIAFVRREGRELSDAGRLTSTRRPRADDGCRASCAGWFRDARAVFIGDRIFALLAYELVEGEMTPDGVVREVRRLDFAPPAPEGEGG